MPHSISRRAAVQYALATLVSLTTFPFTWTWVPSSKNGSFRLLLDLITPDLIPTASAKSSTLSAQITVHPINNGIATSRFSPFLHNAYYLSHEGRFHQPILEATRSFRTDHAIQLTLQERLNSNHSLLS